MNPVIMLITAIVLLLGAFIRSIDWRGRAVKWVGNNPKHAQVYVKSGGTQGGTVRTFEGERDKHNELIYNWNDNKDKKSIILTVNYPEEFIRGRRIIGVQDGKPVASPLGFMSETDLKAYRETSVETSAILNSQAVIKVLQSISDTKPFNWTMAIIIGIAAVAGLWWYSNQHKPVVTPAQSNNVTIQTNNTTSGLILVTPPITVTP